MSAKRNLGFVFSLFLLPFLVCVSAVARDNAFYEKTGNLYLYLGVDAGLSVLNTDVVGEADKLGLGLNTKLGLSYYWDAFVLDGRFGWGLNTVSGDRNDGTRITERNGSLFFDVSPRFRLGDEFQIGPVFEGRFGTDLSYKPSIFPVLAGEPELNFAMFLGAEALYETSNSANPVRIGLRFLTDLNIDRRQFFGVQALLQVGFRLAGSPEPVEPMFEDAGEPVEAVESIEEPIAEVEKEVIANPERFVDIPFLKLHFKTNSDRLQPSSFQLAERVAEFLANNKDSFSVAEVEGHTDDRGSRSHNLRLSQRRAAALKGILVAQGVPNSQIRSRGFGEDLPIVKGKTSAARAKNRRVRLKLYDVNDPQRFKMEIERIRDLFSLREPTQFRRYRKYKKTKTIRRSYRRSSYRR